MTVVQSQKKNRVEEHSSSLNELAEAIDTFNITMREGFRKVHDQIYLLESRWGIQDVDTFRNKVLTFMKKAKYQVSRGYYGGREVDLVIRNGEHILLEVTSSAVKKDVEKLNRSAEDYFQKHGIEPKLMLAAVYVPPYVMREITDSPRPIEIFSDEEI
ncbi:MAG: DUF3782 domain-containing protein [Leptospiraceae bacterium]|nr:DUF3782 domain-containing protein [Leptospiraceae bacterium]